MMFKFGVTVVIFVAVYMFFAIHYLSENDDDPSTKSVMIVDKDGVSVVEKGENDELAAQNAQYSLANE